MMIKFGLLRPALIAAAIAVAAPAMSATVTNGGFETGDLSGWTVRNTRNGTSVVSDVAAFDTTGAGASNAARFQVGVASVTNPLSYGGIFLIQNFAVATAGDYAMSFDVAIANMSSVMNSSGGRFQLLVDRVLVDSFSVNDVAPLAERRDTLAGDLSLGAGNHEIMLRITRKYEAGSTLVSTSGGTPMQFVDNASLRMIAPAVSVAAVPLPASLPLLVAGVGVIGAMRKRRAKA